MMAMLVTLIFVLLKAGLGRGLSLSLTILRSVQMFFLSLLRADFVMNFGFRQFVKRAEVKFVHPVSPGGSVKFLASGVNFSIFTHFLCFFLLKLLKLGEIDGVKFLT